MVAAVDCAVIVCFAAGIGIADWVTCRVGTAAKVGAEERDGLVIDWSGSGEILEIGFGCIEDKG